MSSFVFLDAFILLIKSVVTLLIPLALLPAIKSYCLINFLLKSLDSSSKSYNIVNSFENTSTSYEFSTLIAVQGEEGTSYIASFNGWNSSDMANSTYTWQPLQWDDSKFSNMDVPYIGDYSSIVIDAKKGTVKGN